jgi:serine/threonine protein kinase
MIDQLKNDGEANRPREIARSAMSLLEELGKGRYHWLYRSKHSSLTCVGAFGIVYKGLLEEVPNPAFLVAVKSLHVTANGSDRQELLEEAAVMSQLHHPNIVSSCSLNLVCHNLIRGIHPGSVDWRGDDWKTSLYVGCCWTCSQAAKALLTLILV